MTGPVIPAEGETWDLVVVGAGPAGASAAISALREQPNLRVLLLDRDDFPRDKSCGDGIAPHVLDALAEVGVTGIAAGWEPMRVLELSHGPTRVCAPLARPVWVIPRETFDAQLVDHARHAGAEVRRHRVRRVERRGDGVVVDGTIHARTLVGADGVHSRVRAELAPRRTHNAVAIRGYAPTPERLTGRQLIVFGDRTQPSYAWAFDRGDGLCNVGYGELVAGPAVTRELMLGELERLIPGVRAPGHDWRAHHLPLAGWRWPHPAGPVLLVGDAAGLVNPMTGEGIYYAVATGILAGREAATAARDHGHDPARAYRREVRRLLGRHQRHTALAARLTRSTAVLDAGIRASSQHRGIFDDLVEIGLARGVLSPRLLGGLASQLVRPRVRLEGAPT